MLRRLPLLVAATGLVAATLTTTIATAAPTKVGPTSVSSAATADSASKAGADAAKPADRGRKTVRCEFTPTPENPAAKPVRIRPRSPGPRARSTCSSGPTTARSWSGWTAPTRPAVCTTSCT